jgi:hypothetical protein
VEEYEGSGHARAMTSTVPITEPVGGRYRLEKLLGHGGMADVYRAADMSGGPPVAVKVVRSTDPALARRLTREARAVASFEHPGLVRLLGAGVHDEHAYLVMELVEGETLAERLQHGPLPTGRAAALGASLADALSYVHRRGVVHRDVKPGNVLLDADERARLADFGIAQVLDASSATMTGTTLGTAAYMAPEQLAHHRVGPAADVWALGAVLLECLTGRRPFDGPPAEVVARRLAGWRPSTEGLPSAWRMALDSMLDPDPARRPEAGEAAELLKAPVFARPWDPRPTEMLDAAPTARPEAAAPTQVGGPPTALAPGPVPLPARRRRHGRRTVALAAVVVALALLTALSAWAFGGGSSAPHQAHRAPPASSTTTTTTAPPVTVASASAALVSDVQGGLSSGSLAHSVGQQLLDELGQALSAQANGDDSGAEAALGKMDQTIFDAAGAGTATAAEADTISSDVATLAAAMGVANPSSTTTTAPPAPTPAPGPGHGPGGGGNGDH